LSKRRQIVGQSGLGPALAPTLLEHVKYWPSWSKRDDFQKWVGFPATDIRASSDETKESEKVTGVLFTYKGERYGVRFIDQGSNWLPDGDVFHSGKVDFVANGETVLGLDISLHSDEFAVWRWNNLYAFKVGPWTKHLIEIAAHIENNSQSSSKKWHEDDVIARAKNIRL
jgi:hypothetical protein